MDAGQRARKYLDLFRDTKFARPANYVAGNDPHADMWAKFFPGERKKLTEWMRVYYAMVANLDENVGRLYAAVKELGIEEDTVFVFTSDHGEMFGAHGRRAKNIFYDEAVRVPFLIGWKGHIAPGRRDFCFNTVDIMPTLLSLMGLPCPDDAEGRDLSRCLLTDATDDEPSLMRGRDPPQCSAAARSGAPCATRGSLTRSTVRTGRNSSSTTFPTLCKRTILRANRSLRMKRAA